MATETEVLRTPQGFGGVGSTSPESQAEGLYSDVPPCSDDFGPFCPTYGDHSLLVGFGPIRLRLEGLSARQAALLMQRYGRFRATGGRVTARVRLGPARVPHFLYHRPGVFERYRMERRQDGRTLTLWSYEFAGRLDVEARKADLRLVEPEGVLHDRGLENYLRVLTASFVLEAGGFLLHGAGIVRDGKAFVFFGPSGAGKTTITQLSPDDLVLSDDLTLVVRTPRGYEAAGIPFGLAHHHVPESAGSFPIDSFNMLVQAAAVRRTELAPAQALAEIAGCLPFVMQDTAQSARGLDNVANVVWEVPVHRLEFRKDASFWNVLTEAS